ncbi:MAG: PilZ domain-containing protein [Sulfuricellaceae bacterium]
MTPPKDNADTYTLDFPAAPKAINTETDLLEEDNSLFADDLMREVSDLGAGNAYCEPEPPLPPGFGAEEKRAFPRFLVNWKVVVMNEVNGKREFFHGRAHDISMGGLCLYSEINLSFKNSILVLISVPPNSAKHKPHVLEVYSKISYTVLASNVSQFRIGIRFVKFKEGDKRFLEEYLAQRYDILM